MLRQKSTQVCHKSYWKKQPFIFTVYLMNHVFQIFRHLYDNGIKKNLIDCVNMWKTSEAANLVFPWIFVLNSVKHKFFPVSIVKSRFFNRTPQVAAFAITQKMLWGPVSDLRSFEKHLWTAASGVEWAIVNAAVEVTQRTTTNY